MADVLPGRGRATDGHATPAVGPASNGKVQFSDTRVSDGSSDSRCRLPPPGRWVCRRLLAAFDEVLEILE